MLALLITFEFLDFIFWGSFFNALYCSNAIYSPLFKQWLMNLQSESGILTKGAMSLKRVLIQVLENYLVEFYCCFHFLVVR